MQRNTNPLECVAEGRFEKEEKNKNKFYRLQTKRSNGKRMLTSNYKAERFNKA